MNQTKPKTIEQILNKFDEYKTEEYGKWKIGRVEARDFIRTSITTLLESLKREDMVDYNDEFDMPSDGYNQRNKELEEDINKILGI